MKKEKNADVPSELDEAVASGAVYITIAGEKEVTVENYRGIISYDPESVKINTQGRIVKVSGSFITLSHITDEIVSVSGQIDGVEFI